MHVCTKVHTCCMLKKERKTWLVKAKKKGTVSKDLQTPVICGFVITLEITPPILDIDNQKTDFDANMAFDVFCIFWQKCEATKGSQCPAGYSHNRASIYIMTGRDMLLPRIRLFARIPKVASSRDAAQSQSKRWLIEVFSFLMSKTADIKGLEIDSFAIFKP